DDGAKLDEGAHVYDDDQDTTCNTCGYERTVTPAPTPAEPTVTGVTVTAAGNATTVENDGTLQLSAAVAGENNPAQTVTWSIKEGATATGATVSASGLLSAGTVAGSVTVVATSTVDTSKKGEITITVEEAELDLEVEIAGLTTIAEGGSITLTATVTGVPAGGETGVIWSVDDEDVATITQEGVLTGVTPGTVTVTAKAKADESFYATFDVVITAASTYDKFANRADNIIAENFNAMEEGAQLTEFSNYGTKGIYVSSNSVTPVKVTAGTLSLGSSSGGGNVDVIVDYGTALNQEVEGYLELTVNSTATQTNKPTIVFESGKGNEVLSILYSGSATTNIGYKVNGTTTAPAVEIAGATSLKFNVYYKFNVVAGTFTLKINDSEVFTDQAIDIDGTVGISGVKISTHNSGKGTCVLDNVVVCATEMTIDNYKTIVDNTVSALETTYGLGGAQYNNRIKGSYVAAIEAATTLAEVDSAYDALYAGVLNMYIDLADYHVNQELWIENYTHDSDKVEALKATITDEIYEMTKIEDAYAASNSDFADRLEAAGIHEDSYYAAVDVTVVIYEKGTTTSVVKSDANLTNKSGEEITFADLKAAITVPSGKAIKGLYSDADCTTAITGDITLDAGTATEATQMIIYVEFEEINEVTHTLEISATSALTETTLLNDIFYGTKNLKTENDKNGTSYSIQISLTSGKVAAADAPANGIMFTVSGPTTVTIVCGQKSDKSTKLSVLNNDGSAATVSNITKNGESVSAFETLATGATPDVYTFTLEAGTYHLGGAGGGVYVYALTVVETVVA
ncbi:MAG: Ig domain-containing protein, partial [Candidatus Coproplasma sp.]